MKKQIIIIFGILVIIVFLFVLLIINSKNNNNENEIVEEPIKYEEAEDNIEEKTQDTTEKIEEKIKEQGLNASLDMYEIVQEYDGREILVIKANIQYKVALAGIIKGNKPEYDEIEEILKNAPTHSGIWINKKNQKHFLEIINKICKSKYDINDEGYLIVKSNSGAQNELDKKIKKMLSSGNLYVFDINSTTYIVNETTGNIEEYPFEEMDPEQGYEYFEDENKFMYIISNNSAGKVNQETIIKSILNNK